MTQVMFTNPATGATYVWPKNPQADNEQPHQKQRAIERLSNTGNVGATKQQGDTGPLVLDWTILVPDRGMELALLQWGEICEKQTIYLTDWDGDEYEGQIILLSRARKAAANPYATYQFQFEIYRCISGLLYDAGVTP